MEVTLKFKFEMFGVQYVQTHNIADLIQLPIASAFFFLYRKFGKLMFYDTERKSNVKDTEMNAFSIYFRPNKLFSLFIKSEFFKPNLLSHF